MQSVADRWGCGPFGSLGVAACRGACILRHLGVSFKCLCVFSRATVSIDEKGKCEGGSTSDTDFIYEKGGRVRLQAVA